MTLPLETASVSDEYARRALDNIAQTYPIAPVSTLGGIPTSTATFPASPINGQDFFYQLSAGGLWHFKYNSTSAKWDFVGGPWLSAAVDTSETTVSTTYAALATAGPSVALPFAGDYAVEIGVYMRTSTATASVLMSYDIGGTGAVDANAAHVDSAAASLGSSVSRTRELTGLTAVTLTAKYKTTAGTGTFADRIIRVLPRRCS